MLVRITLIDLEKVITQIIYLYYLQYMLHFLFSTNTVGTSCNAVEGMWEALKRLVHM